MIWNAVGIAGLALLMLGLGIWIGQTLERSDR